MFDDTKKIEQFLHLVAKEHDIDYSTLAATYDKFIASAEHKKIKKTTSAKKGTPSTKGAKDENHTCERVLRGKTEPCGKKAKNSVVEDEEVHWYCGTEKSGCYKCILGAANRAKVSTAKKGMERTSTKKKGGNAQRLSEADIKSRALVNSVTGIKTLNIGAVRDKKTGTKYYMESTRRFLVDRNTNSVYGKLSDDKKFKVLPLSQSDVKFLEGKGISIKKGTKVDKSSSTVDESDSDDDIELASDSDSEEEPAPKKGKAVKPAKGKTGKKSKAAKVESESDDESSDSEEEPVPKKGKAVKPAKPTKSKAAKVESESEDDSSDSEDEPAPKSSKGKKSKVESESEDDSSDSEEEPAPKKGKAAKPTKPTKSKSAKVESDSDSSSSESEEEPAPKKGKAAKPTKAAKPAKAAKGKTGKKSKVTKAESESESEESELDESDSDSDVDIEVSDSEEESVNISSDSESDESD